MSSARYLEKWFFFGRFMPKRKKQAISHKGINYAADNSIETGDMVSITQIGDNSR